MQSVDRTPLELKLEISNPKFLPQLAIKMSKTLYAGFVPQHGMEIVDTEIIFKVKTIPLAGLSSAIYIANPIRNGKWIEGNRKVIGKLFPRDEKQFKESVDFFSKEGWKIEK